LIVEAAEDEFVPACVYNNVEGEDARVLASFDEATWNNPVVRIIDTQEHDIVPRNGADWTVSGVSGAMVAALEHRERTVPRYLELLSWEDRAGRTNVQTAVFGMT